MNEPRYPLRLDLSAPALVVVVGLEGPVDVAVIGNRAEAGQVRRWIDADPIRRALLVFAFLAAGVEPDEPDEDGGEPEP